MRLLKYDELSSLKGIPWTRTHIYREIRAGRFPGPVHLGGQTVGWPEPEIDDWIRARIAQRDTPEGKAAQQAISDRARANRKDGQRIKRLATKPRRKRSAEQQSETPNEAA
jgi:prophage regulatory protein